MTRYTKERYSDRAVKERLTKQRETEPDVKERYDKVGSEEMVEKDQVIKNVAN